MFESLKKKFSRTSEKLEEELKEEAIEENNFKEEEGTKPSFFDFGKTKEALSEDNSPVEEEEKSSFWSRSKDDDSEDDKEEKSGFWSRSKDDDSEDVKDEKSHFWSRSKDDDSEDDDSEDDKDEKSHFWSRSKDDDSEDDDSEDEKEEKSHFWSRNKDKKDDGESKGGLFSFVTEKTISEKHLEDILWDLEMGLLEGDVAMDVATEVVNNVKENLVGKKIKRSNDIGEFTYDALKEAVREIIDIPGKSMTEMIEEKKQEGKPLIVMFVGINGTGKTTTIAKLAHYYQNKGYTPVIAASDTFRAGAIEQVTHHATNLDVKIIKHNKGSDPAAVAFDAVEHATAQGKELVLIDTAGRMQTNINLMDEMKKIKRVSKPDLVVFVGDALTGNDATQQAVKFNDAIDIDGVILTKADADSKGGASLSIGYMIKKPILFLGMGQGYDDIMEYDAEWMLNQLFSDDEDED